MSDQPTVVFFDLDALLERHPGRPPRVRPAARRRLGEEKRVGVLANAPAELGAAGILRTLVALGIDGYIERDLVMDAAQLPTPLPDRRAFAAAAALAEVRLGECLFVSTRQVLLEAASAAGMAAEGLGPAAAWRGPPPSDIPRAAPLGEELAALVAALIDEDVGPAFVLEGRVVTMSLGRIHERGRVAVRRGRIVAVAGPDDGLPASMAGAPVIETGGTIYPGLLDLHNHYVYNVAPLWRVPRRYDNRNQWSGVRSKNADVSLPVRLLAGYSPTARAIVRFVEAKALLGGTTTGQGMKTQVRGGFGLFRGAMRNVESTQDPRLPDSATLVPTLGRRAEDFESFRRSLDKRAELGGSYFYHLAEGTDAISLRTYTDLRDNTLVQPPLTGIHCLALGGDDLRELGRARSKIVWSPFSNLLLYGQTLDVAALLASGARWSIGSDWTPSGSRNLLFELKVARHVARVQGAKLESRHLVSAVTADAAYVCGWSRYLGRLRNGMLADLLVVRGTGGDAYEHLVDATEEDVSLVVVHGMARYGDRDMMEALHAHPAGELEPWRVGGTDKAFELDSPSSALNGLTLAEAQRRLRDALGDLPAFRQQVEAEDNRLRAMGVEPEETFTLVLDNEPGGLEDEFLFEMARADWSMLPQSLSLDELVVGAGDWWSRLDDQPNLDQALKDELHAIYQGA
jgi:5-methylthioadenosine/S-adenosylhomocysteine deaminase